MGCFDWLFGVDEKKLNNMSTKQLIKTSQKNRAGKVKSRSRMKSDKQFKKNMKKKGW